MFGRLILAGSVALVMAALLPGINTFMRDITENVISGLPLVTEFEMAYWQLIPVVMLIWFVFVVPLYILVRRKRKPENDRWRGGPYGN